MKNFLPTALIWLVLSFIFYSVIASFFTNLATSFSILLFTASILCVAPLAFFAAKQIFSQGEAKQIQKSYTLATQLGLSGTIKGPDFGLPAGFTIRFRHAKQSPVIFHYYNTEGFYRGYKVDFGNGIIGNVDGTQITQFVSGKLGYKSTGPHGSQSANW